jgi:berberine-like enzyme
MEPDAWCPHRKSDRGRTSPFRGEGRKVRNRRISPVAAHSGDRLLSEPRAATAFVHRSSQWLINTILNWTDCDGRERVRNNLRWQRRAQNTFSGILHGSGSYQNFSDPELDNHAEAYWGINLSRLSRAKGAVDHGSVFTPPRNQGIPQPA